MNTMTYRTYAAQVYYSDDDDCFVGHIAGIDDIVGFHGSSVEELRHAFKEAVDDYIHTCEKLNRSPQSGSLTINAGEKALADNFWDSLRPTDPEGAVLKSVLREREES